MAVGPVLRSPVQVDDDVAAEAVSAQIEAVGIRSAGVVERVV